MYRRSVFSFTRSLRTLALALCLLALAAAPGRAQSGQDPVYVFHTNLGDIAVRLYRTTAPRTVANFLNYVNRGDYTNSVFHRSVPGFIIQGGAYRPTAQSSFSAIPTDPPVVNEYSPSRSNLRGTIAMAKLGGNPNSATSQWFFNESDANASNLDNQNGGFTVFGKVLDKNSLAVMDKLAAVPVPSPPPLASPFDQIPLMNYQAGQSVQTSNLVIVNSITPVTVTTHLLWTNPDGRAVLWDSKADGSFGDHGQYGPYTDSGGAWRAAAVATGPTGVSRLLWTNPDGRAVLWYVNPDGSHGDYGQYGPYINPGGVWRASAVSVGPDNVAHILWTNPDGRAVLWYVNPDGTHGDYGQYGPYTESSGVWRASALATGPGGVSRILWTNPDGREVLWYVNPDGSHGDTGQFGPYTDAGGTWQATAVAVGIDGLPHLLWTNPSGRSVLWDGKSDGTYTDHGQYGPYTDAGGTWRTTAVSFGPDNLPHLLWSNPNGRSVLWNGTFDGTYTDHGQYGPYTDAGGTWLAAATSAGP